MRRENLVLCGGIDRSGELVEIKCDPSVGELVFESELEGAVSIGELSVIDPIVLPSVASLPPLLRECGLKGAIYTRKGVYAILSDTVAELRPLTNVKTATNDTVTIDLNIEAEFDEDDDDNSI